MAPRNNQGDDLSQIDTMLTTPQDTSTIKPVLVLPRLVVLFVAYKEMLALPEITLGVLAELPLWRSGAIFVLKRRQRPCPC